MFADYRGAVSSSTEEMRRFHVRYKLGLGRFFAPRADVVQMPERWEGRQLVTPALVRTLARAGIPVHVWTVDEPADMHRLLEWGVEGIITDRTDLLGRVLHERTGRALMPAHGA
jgi:glycerophosphoryl diester phosphodiesterase